MKKAMLILAAAILCILCITASAEETIPEMTFCDLSFRLELRPASGVKSAGVYQSADLSGKPAERIAADSGLILLGSGKKSWKIQYGDKTGYVSKSKMNLVGIPDGHAPVSGAVSSSTLRMANTMVRPKDEDYILLNGAQELSVPVDYFAFFLWDEWQGKLERTWLYAPEKPVSAADAADWQRVMTTKGLNAGRKMLCIQGFSSGSGIVLARLPFFVAGKAEDPANLNSLCTFLPNDQRLLDSNPETCWSPTEKRKELTITLPEHTPAALLQVEWYKPPEKTEITVSDKAGKILLNRTLETGFYVDAVELPENACTVVIHPYGTRLRMSSVRVYGKDYPREVVQQWQPMPEKMDLLLFSTHQDDEILFFSGLVPWYSHLGEKLGIVYMANCGRARCREALDGIWISGMRIHPVFLGYKDADVSSFDVATNLWPDSQTAIVREIRRCKPDVIVVQDLNGEYGHTQHRLTSSQVCRGTELAADPSYDPESAAQYGTWDVKKLYVHLYENNQVHMDWHIPLEELGGFTPWEIAVEAFEMHHSQYGYFRMERQSITYDSSLFGLYRTTVGPDTTGNDMFEHID